MNPFFSIVIPTFNRALLVKEAIQSALLQTFEDFEVIVVDDGSTDNTESVVAAIASPRLSYFKKENQERGAARNFGLNKSKGQYVVFLDSDDRMLTNHLETLHKHLLHQSENFIATKYFFFDKEKQHVSRDVKSLREGYHSYQTFLIGNPLACCFTVRKENPELIRFREELDYVVMEDWIFLLENLRHDRLYLIDVITLGMRDHELRSMKSNAKKIIAARVHALVHLIQSLKLSPDEKKILKGNSSYFCAVHAYIGGETKSGFQYLKRSFFETGPSLNACWLLTKLCAQWVWPKKRES